MSYITRFGGYTPEDDLAASDWTLRFDLDASATILGIDLVYVGAANDATNGTSFGFANAAANATGTYVIVVYGQGNADGISYVEVDGMVADPIVEYSASNENHGIYIVYAASMLDGDTTVVFNNAVNGCAIAVYQMFGLTDGLAADGTAGAAMDSYQALSVDTLAALIGTGGYLGASWVSDGHYWYGLVEDIEQDIDTTLKHSAASLRRTFVDTSISVGIDAAITPTTSHWLAATWNTPATYFPHGQGADFAKQVSDDYTFWSWNQVSQIADVELVALIRPTAQSDSFRCGVLARGAGADGTDTGYALVLAQSGAGAMDQLVLLDLVLGAESTLATASFSWALNTNYWLKLRISSSSIKGRVWAEANTEPSTWNISVTDTSISDAGYVGIFHQYISSTFEIGYFSARVLYAEWPSTVPMNWTTDISGGPRDNKISFIPDVGPSIDRRRGSATTRMYRVTVPGLDQTEYLAFVDFYHTTLEEGTLPFMTTDPFTGEEKTYKFVSQDQGYGESVQRPPGTSYTDGLYQVEFDVMRLD